MTPAQAFSLLLLLLAGVDLLRRRICMTEVGELLPRSGQVELAELLGELERLAHDAFLLIVVAKLKWKLRNETSTFR